MNSAFLFDTCAVIWISQNDWISGEARVVLEQSAANEQSSFVSAITAWELAMLSEKGRIATTKTAERWYRMFLEQSGATEIPSTAEILIASCCLPQLEHRDPIDRILIATAREYDLTLITRDRAILAYGAAGHVKTLAC